MDGFNMEVNVKMRQVTILLMKFITCLVAFAIGLDLFFDATMAHIVSFSLVVTAVTYVLGDRILLSRIGNSQTLISEFLLAYTSVWLFGSVLLDSYLQIAWASIISATIIIAAEAVIHRYILQTVADKSRNPVQPVTRKPAYGMEMAEEKDPVKKK
jgi:hypothetical protein